MSLFTRVIEQFLRSPVGHAPGEATEVVQALARDYDLSGASHAELRNLSELHAFLDEPPNASGFVRGSLPLEWVGAELKIHEPRDLLRAYQHAKDQGLALTGTGSKPELTDLLKSYRDRDPHFWNGLAHARDYQFEDLSDAELRGLSEVHDYLGVPAAQGFRRGYEGLGSVGLHLNIFDDRQVLRMYQNAKDHGLTLTGRGTGAALADSLRGY
jgi:hypothetical protein